MQQHAFVVDFCQEVTLEEEGWTLHAAWHNVPVMPRVSNITKVLVNSHYSD